MAAAYVTYRYFTTDLLTGIIIGEFDFTNVSWGLQLNGPGDFNGTLNINDVRINVEAGTSSSTGYTGLEYATQPGRTGLFVERNGSLVWGGIIWTRTWDSEAQQLQITAQTFDTYLDHRFVESADASQGLGSGVLAFDQGTDQFLVMVGARGLTTVANGAGGVITNLVAQAGSIQFAVAGLVNGVSTTTSGIGIPGPLVIFDYEKKTAGQVLKDLSSQTQEYGDSVKHGFDWSFEPSYSGTNQIITTFTMYYPSKGYTSTTSATLPVLEFPGGAVKYTWPEDGTSLITQLYGMGPGSAEGQYVSMQRPSTPLYSYPLLQDVESFTQVPDPSAVDKLTQAHADIRSNPVATPQFVWVPNTTYRQVYTSASAFSWQDVPNSPQIGEFQVGDKFRLRLNDDRFYGGADMYMRLAKFTVQVGDSSSAETVTGDFSVITY